MTVNRKIAKVPPHVFYAYLWHGLIRVARLWAPEVQPWQQVYVFDAPKEDTEAIYDFTRSYFGAYLYKIPRDDLAGLILASQRTPTSNPDLVSELLDYMVFDFWETGDIPWLQHGIFEVPPPEREVPYMLEEIVFDALSNLIIHYQNAFAVDQSTLILYSPKKDIKNPLEILLEAFDSTLSPSLLRLALDGCEYLTKTPNLSYPASLKDLYTSVIERAAERSVKFLDSSAQNQANRNLVRFRDFHYSFDLLQKLKNSFGSWLRPDIISVHILHKRNQVFLEIVATEDGEDEEVNRINLSTVCRLNKGNFPFSFQQSPNQNAQTFLENLDDDYLVIYVAKLLTQDGCEAFSKTHAP